MKANLKRSTETEWLFRELRMAIEWGLFDAVNEAFCYVASEQRAAK